VGAADVSGYSTACRVCGGPLQLHDETFDAIDRAFVGLLQCSACGEQYLEVDHRKGTRMQPEPTTPPQTEPPPPTPAPLPIPDAPESIIVIDPDAAPQQLYELAELYAEIERLAGSLKKKVAAVKSAKKAHDDAITHLLARLRAFTYQPPLPLFDALDHAADLAAMTAGGPVDGKTAAADAGA